MVQEIKFKGLRIMSYDDDFHRMTFEFGVPAGVDSDEWNKKLIDLMANVQRDLARGDRKCLLYNFTKGKFEEAGRS